jgi:hypothetical protein
MSIEEEAAFQEAAAATVSNVSVSTSPRRLQDETPRSRRQRLNNLNQSIRRIIMTTPEQELVSVANRRSHAQRRSQLEEEELAGIREANRIAHAERRDRLSEEERDLQREVEDEAGVGQPRAPPIQPHRDYMRARCNRTPLAGEVTFEALDIERCDIGLVNLICPDCGARNFQHENRGTNANPQFSICCGKGKVRLPELGPIPQVIEDCLFVKDDGSNRLKVATFFIRKINNALAFASVNVNNYSKIQSRTSRIQNSRSNVSLSFFI